MPGSIQVSNFVNTDHYLPQIAQCPNYSVLARHALLFWIEAKALSVLGMV